jgi:probable metal-binding protein
MSSASTTAHPSVHGHDVIDMICAARTPYSRAGLVAAIVEKFGPETRFHTCSADGLDADGLIDFLLSRQKLVGDASALEFSPAGRCNH